MKQFVIDHQKDVIAQSSGGLLPSVAMAQMIQESRWGQSLLSVRYNNFFGIKADKSWQGPRVNLDTGEVYSGDLKTENAAFRVYDSPAASIADRVKFLKENPRYKAVFTARTAADQARALQAAGYATDPNYAANLIALINQEQLTSLDEKKKSMNKLDYILAGLIGAAFLILLYKLFI